MTVNWCGLNDQHRATPLMGDHNTPTYENNTVSKIIWISHGISSVLIVRLLSDRFSSLHNVGLPNQTINNL